MIGIVDYRAGNIRSVKRALDALHISHIISNTPAEFEHVDRLIFPGVGQARYAMEQLKKSGFDVFLRDWAASGKPLLGICLGSQIIFDYSEEGSVQCLGLVPGKIRHLANLYAETASKTNEDFSSYKIPHMGWNSLNHIGNHCLFSGVDSETDFYFVHSYVIEARDPETVTAQTHYGIAVPAAVQYKNIHAFQFHPEKSGQCGLQILKNFAALSTQELGGWSC